MGIHQLNRYLNFQRNIYSWIATITVSVLFLMLCSCKQDAKVIALDKSAVVAEAREMLDNYHRDIKEKGLLSEFKYLDRSDAFFWAPPGYDAPLKYDAIKAAIEKNAVLFKSLEFEWDQLEIIPLTNEIANFAGVLNGTLIDTSGITTLVKLVESGTLIKRSDGWKLLSGQTALVPNEKKD